MSWAADSKKGHPEGDFVADPEALPPPYSGPPPYSDIVEWEYTPWVLRLDTTQQKCVDANLFCKPFDPSQSAKKSESMHNPQGTVALPIKPEPPLTLMGFSIMTISNVLYTPGEKNSELSWQVLEKHGFSMKKVHRFNVVKDPDRTGSGRILKRLPADFTKGQVYAVAHPNIGGNVLYASQLGPDPNRLSILPMKVNAEHWENCVMKSVLGQLVNLRGTFITREQPIEPRSYTYSGIVLYPHLEPNKLYGTHRQADVDLLTSGEEVTTVLAF